MKYSTKVKKQSSVQINLQFDDKDLIKAKKATVQYLNSKMKLDGFRKGKVTEQVLIEKMGEEAFANEIKTIGLEIFYAEIIKSENITPISAPQVKELSSEPLIFEILVDVFPKLTLGEYKNIKVKKDKVKIKDDEVDKAIDNIRKQMTKYKPVDRNSKKGDKVEVDFEGFDENNQAVEGTKSLNHPIIIGMNTFIPGFEDHLIGLKANDDKIFDITFPADYGKQELQNKKITFIIKMKKIEEPIETLLNDEFAVEASRSQAKNMKEFKELVVKAITDEKEGQVKRDYENKVLEKFTKLVDIELPDSLIKNEMTALHNDFSKEMEAKGITMEKYLEIRKLDQTKFQKELEEQAIRRITLNLGLKELMEKEKIKLTKKELDNTDGKEESSNKLMFNKTLDYLYNLAENNA